MRRLTLCLALAALLFLLTGEAAAQGTGACAKSLANDKALLSSFGPARRSCFQFAEEAGALHCGVGKCALLDEGPDVPAFITAHSVLLGAGAPALTLTCNSAGTTVCALGLPGAEYALLYDIKSKLLVVPGDGCLYSVQSWDSDHLVRRKLCWRSGKIQELTQPFSYVGSKTTTNSNLRLHATPNDSSEVLHVVRPGQAIEVLVSNYVGNGEWGPSTWILVKDPFGLVGWVSVKALEGGNSCLLKRNSINGFCYDGS